MKSTGKGRLIRIAKRLTAHRPFAWLAAQLMYPRFKKSAALCKAVDDFLSPQEREDRRFVRRVKKDAFYSKRVYRVSYTEYFLFRFPLLNDRGRRTYVGDYERMAIMERVVNERTLFLFSNKYETYKAFRPYYHRETILIRGPEDRDAYDKFVSGHRELIVKPVDQSLGSGIFLADPADEADAEELFRRICSEGAAIVEERIRQSADLASLHPASVNTIRLLTKYNSDGSVSLIEGFLKIGRGGNCVDNGGQGGLLAAIDLASGVVTSLGITEKLEEFIFHPDTGRQIVGFSLPDWDEAKKLAEELARVIPEQKIVGWDLAHTDDGWVMVEGNSKSMFVGWQLTQRKGWRSTAEKVLAEWMEP